eukprot:TRINITY_DN14531_c1_g1_i2.p1 TRINITY_DN14531_c1_g1~~TRINITY_DN14531_c1_g1_i2.p1  ORF type:complete len:163 (-),score=15.45 TRINITY_DN14531_c1_g1_i2:108-596(-)
MGSSAWGQFSGERLTYPFHPLSLVSPSPPAPHLVPCSASIGIRTEDRSNPVLIIGNHHPHRTSPSPSPFIEPCHHPNPIPDRITSRSDASPKTPPSIETVSPPSRSQTLIVTKSNIPFARICHHRSPLPTIFLTKIHLTEPFSIKPIRLNPIFNLQSKIPKT